MSHEREIEGLVYTYTNTWDIEDPLNRMAYLLENLDVAEAHLLNTLDNAWNLAYRLAKTPSEDDALRVVEQLDQALQDLELLRLQLCFPHPDDPPIEE